MAKRSHDDHNELGINGSRNQDVPAVQVCSATDVFAPMAIRDILKMPNACSYLWDDDGDGADTPATNITTARSFSVGPGARGCNIGEHGEVSWDGADNRHRIPSLAMAPASMDRARPSSRERGHTEQAPESWIDTRMQLGPSRNLDRKGDWVRCWSESVAQVSGEAYCGCSCSSLGRGFPRGRSRGGGGGHGKSDNPGHQAWKRMSLMPFGSPRSWIAKSTSSSRDFVLSPPGTAWCSASATFTEQAASSVSSPTPRSPSLLLAAMAVQRCAHCRAVVPRGDDDPKPFGLASSFPARLGNLGIRPTEAIEPPAERTRCLPADDPSGGSSRYGRLRKRLYELIPPRLLGAKKHSSSSSMHQRMRQTFLLHAPSGPAGPKEKPSLPNEMLHLEPVEEDKARDPDAVVDAEKLRPKRSEPVTAGVAHSRIERTQSLLDRTHFPAAVDKTATG